MRSVALLESLEARRLFVAGELDETFSGDGKLTTNILNKPNSAAEVAVLVNGKILVAGTTGTSNTDDIALVRYLRNGDLDSTFGAGGADGDGIIVKDLTGFNEVVTCMVLQPDGKIVVGGQTTFQLNLRAFVARFNKDGSIDQSFDGDGYTLPNFGVNGSIINDIAIQPNGSIVAVATVPGIGADNSRIGVARLTDTGANDFSFGGGGIGVFQAGSDVDRVNAVAIQENGKIVICGGGVDGSKEDDIDLFVWRFNKDGSFDDDFGAAGKLFVDEGDSDEEGFDVVILPTKVIAVGGSSDESAVVWSIPANGDPEEVGASSADAGDLTTYHSLAANSDNQVVAVGTTEDNDSRRVIVSRFNVTAGGSSIILGFSVPLLSYTSTPFFSVANSVAIQRDGQIILAGTNDPTATTVSTADIGLIRINNFGHDLGAISGRVFVDRNANGKLGKSDPGLGGARVFVDYDLDNKFDPADEPSTLSYPNGVYTIPGLNPNSYHVRELVPKRFVRTAPVKPAYRTVFLTVGISVKGVNFGNQSRAIISGFVFNDADFSFHRNDDEEGLEDFTVFIDENENGERDDDEVFVKTDANGFWKFKGLNPGTYFIGVKVKTGYTATIGPVLELTLKAGGLLKDNLLGVNEIA